MTFKTLQEQEREAYITGHVFMADLLAKADDAELAESINEDRLAELEEEINCLQAELDDAQETVIELESTVAEREAHAAELQDELDAK